jgi:hypothetical protein
VNPRHLAMATAAVVSATVILTLLWLLNAPSPPVTAGAVTTTSTRYVSTTGTDSDDCTDSTSPCRTVQYAVDQATEGSIIKVASGVYTDIHQRANITQVVYISRSVTIRGGYSTSNWTMPGPDAHLTILNPQGQGRVIVVTGSITVTVAGFYLTGGDATGQQAPCYGYGAYCGGGVHVTRARFAMSGTIIFDNKAPHYGGGLWVGDGDSLLLTHSEIIMTMAHYEY